MRKFGLEIFANFWKGLCKKGDENMKKAFVNLEIEVVLFDELDVIRTSGNISEDEGEDDGEWM